MTHATKAIYRWLLSDFIKVSNIATEQMLYSEQDLETSMEKIETINFHEEKEVNGIKFWAYNAGHVLGAAMFMIEVGAVQLLRLDLYRPYRIIYDTMTPNNDMAIA